MILAFEENEENILNRILSCISKEADVLKHEVIHKEELSFKGLYIDKYKRIVVREDNEIDLMQFTVSSGLHSVLERPFSEANGRSFLVKRLPLIVC